MTVSVQNATARRDLGVATAALSFVRSLGGMGGVAAYGTILIAFGAVAAVTPDAALARANQAAMLMGYRLVLAAAAAGALTAMALLLW
ncbi:hypothetical protein J8J40_26290, partial [Mycobacterium tuberculosis]|nr:hypothetical protein [Mycobacterium tuberculosis]